MNFKQWLILSETITVKDQEFRDPLYALKHIQATHPNPENLVVTFTAIDKVGINPKSGYNTPLGIYFYPIDYVIEKRMNVPFAKEQPYLNVCEFTRPDKILHMTDDVNNQKGLELLNVFPQEEVDLAMENISNNYMLRSNYSELWLVTREIAFHNPILWNANLRKCEIDGFVDHNTKTIHGNEPTQGVVFTGTALRRILVIPQILRKPLPDINKITLNQLENLLKNRNLFNNDIQKFLNDAENKDEIARIIIQYKPELSNDDISTLLYYAENKDKMINFIIKYKTELSGDNVAILLAHASDKEKMVEILGSDNINKLSDDDIYILLRLTKNIDEMARILGPDNINKLTAKNVSDLLEYASGHKKMAEMAEILGQENINKLTNPDNINKLTAKNVSDLLEYASGHKKMAEMAEILGQENINKLTAKNVSDLLAYASGHKKMAEMAEMAEILGPDNINKLSNNHIYQLISLASDKEKIARILGPDNINKLNSDNVWLLIHYAYDKEKIARILGPENINKLSGDYVLGLLNSELDKEKAARILGSNNINKLNIDQFNYLCQLDQLGPYGMKQILRKYYTGKNQEVISLLNQ